MRARPSLFFLIRSNLEEGRRPIHLTVWSCFLRVLMIKLKIFKRKFAVFK